MSDQNGPSRLVLPPGVGVISPERRVTFSCTVGAVGEKVLLQCKWDNCSAMQALEIVLNALPNILVDAAKEQQQQITALQMALTELRQCVPGVNEYMQAQAQKLMGTQQ